jgi:segregation and condensation protein B
MLNLRKFSNRKNGIMAKNKNKKKSQEVSALAENLPASGQEMVVENNSEIPQDVQAATENIPVADEKPTVTDNSEIPQEVATAAENLPAAGRKQKADKNIEIPQEIFESMSSYIEALLFASDEPIPPKSLSEILTEFFSSGKNGEIDPNYLIPDALRCVVEGLNNRYKERNQSFHIIEIAGGFQFATLPKYAKCLGILFKEKSKRRLSQSALETLAIIVFKQPISKPDIENIRGVNSDYVLSTLLEKDLVTIVGRGESVGRPLLYGTTSEFLKHFGLKDTKDLPKLKEIDEIMKSDEFKFEVKRLEESFKKDEETSEEGDELEINPDNIPADAQLPAAAAVSETAQSAPIVDTSEIVTSEDTGDDFIEASEVVELDEEGFEAEPEITEIEKSESLEAVSENEEQQPAIDEETADINDIKSEEEVIEAEGTQLVDETPEPENIPDIIVVPDLEIIESDTSQVDIIDNVESDKESSNTSDDLKKKSSNIEKSNEDNLNTDSALGLGAMSFLFEGESDNAFPDFGDVVNAVPPVESANLLDEITSELSQNDSFIEFQGGDSTTEAEEIIEKPEEMDEDVPSEEFFLAETITPQGEPADEETGLIEEDNITEPVLETDKQVSPIDENIKPLSEEIDLEYFPTETNKFADADFTESIEENRAEENLEKTEKQNFSAEAEAEIAEEIEKLESAEEEIVSAEVIDGEIEPQAGEIREQEVIVPIANTIEEAPLEEEEFGKELEAAADEESVEEIEKLESAEEEIVSAEVIDDEIEPQAGEIREPEVAVPSANTIEEAPLEEEEFGKELEEAADEESVEEIEKLESAEEEIVSAEVIHGEIEPQAGEIREQEVAVPTENIIEEAPLEEEEFGKELEAAADKESVEEIEKLESEEEEKKEIIAEEVIETEHIIDEKPAQPYEMSEEEDELPESDADVLQDYSGYEIESSPIMPFRNLNFDDFVQEEEVKKEEVKEEAADDDKLKELIKDSIEPDFIYKRRRWNYNSIVFEKIKTDLKPVIELPEMASTSSDEEKAQLSNPKESVLPTETIAAPEENPVEEEPASVDNDITETVGNKTIPEFDYGKFSEFIESKEPESGVNDNEDIFKGLKFDSKKPVFEDIEKETEPEDFFEIKDSDSVIFDTEKFNKLIEKELFAQKTEEFDEILSVRYLDVTVKKESSFSEIESFLTQDKYLDFSDKKNEIYTKLNTIYTGKQAGGQEQIKSNKLKIKDTLTQRIKKKIRVIFIKVLNRIRKLFTGKI